MLCKSEQWVNGFYYPILLQKGKCPKFPELFFLWVANKGIEHYFTSMRWVQLCSSLSIIWHCLSLGLEWKLTFSIPVATAEFFKFAGILNVALSQHHLMLISFQLKMKNCGYYITNIIWVFVHYFLSYELGLTDILNSNGQPWTQLINSLNTIYDRIAHYFLCVYG